MLGKLQAYIIGVLLIFALIGGVYVKGRMDGGAGERAKWEAAMRAEQARQDKIVRAVEADAAKRVQAAEQANAELAERVEEIERNVEADPSQVKVDAKTRKLLESIR